MALSALVVTFGETEPHTVKLDDYELVDVLGDKERAMAVRMEEIIQAVTESVRSAVSDETELTIEMTGSTSLNGQAGGKWLLFNIGAEATNTDSLKVVLKTRIRPT